MATLSSINRAQVIKLCELCEEGSIKWRCIDCDKYVCKKCKTIHTRKPLTTKHQLVTIATPLQDVPRNIAMESISWKKHAARLICMFCQTCDCLFPIFREPIDFQVLNTYTTDFPYIEKMLAKTDNSIWISNFSKEKIQQIDITSGNVTIFQEISSQICDMDFTANNDILFSEYKSSDVNLLSQSGEIKPFLSVKPLLPKGIHVTRENEIIVGVREKGNPYKETNQRHRAVMVFDINGTLKNHYQYDKHGKRLFTAPYRILTNNNQDVIIIDGISSFKGRVVCIDRKGRLKFVYEGHSNINIVTEFDPRDLTVTPSGHIILSDYSSHTLHYLGVVI